MLDSEAPVRDYTRALHADVVLCVLDHLVRRDIFVVARTSHHWRAIARTHQNFYLHKRIALEPDPDPAERLEDLCEMLAYVREHDLRASVTVNYSSIPLLFEHTGYRDEPDSTDAFPAESKAESVDPENVMRTERLMDAIIAAVPFLVKLKVDWGPMRPNLSRLVQPAPQLRKLSFVHWIFPEEYDVVEIPATLFAGKAPVLRHLRLKGFTLCSSTIPAFESVYVLDFNNPRYLLDATKTFPDLRHLTTGRSASHSNGTLSLLHSLVTSVGSDHADQNYFRALAVVPRVTVTCFVHDDEDQVPFSTLFAASPVNAPLRLELLHSPGDNFLVSVSTLNRDIVCRCLFPLDPSSGFLAWIAEELEILRSRRFTLLELDVHHHLFDSLSSIFPLGMPDLRTLRVQRPTVTTLRILYTAPMDPLVAVSPIRCPRLERYELVGPFGNATSENLARELAATIQPGNANFEVVYNGAKIRHGALEQVGDNFGVHSSPFDEENATGGEDQDVRLVEEFEDDSLKCLVL